MIYLLVIGFLWHHKRKLGRSAWASFIAPPTDHKSNGRSSFSIHQLPFLILPFEERCSSFVSSSIGSQMPNENVK
jgi:hypothetical protein